MFFATIWEINSPQPPGISIYRMLGSTYPTNSGRTFAIAILSSGPMHLQGWKVKILPSLVVLATSQSAETLVCIAILHGWAHHMATVTHPSSDHCPCCLTWILASDAFTSMAMTVLLFQGTYIAGFNFCSYKYSI